jgi:hypothetical protein
MQTVRDRRVAPVEHAQALGPRVYVQMVQVVVLKGLRYVVRAELGAQLREARRKGPQLTDLVAVERQILLQQVLVACG